MFQTIAALIAVNVLFGLSYPFTKAILGYLSPVSWVFIRLFMATVILGLSQYRSIKADLRLFKKSIWIIAAALFGAVINQLCFNEGLLRTSPAHAAILNATIPIQTLVFASVLARERLHTVRVIGILLGFCGVVYLIGLDHLTRLNPFAIGDMLILANAASYSIYLILAKRYLSGLKPLVVLFWMSLLSVYLSVVISLLSPLCLSVAIALISPLCLSVVISVLSPLYLSVVISLLSPLFSVS